MKRRLLKLFTVVGAITTGFFLLMLTVSVMQCACGEEVEPRRMPAEFLGLKPECYGSVGFSAVKCGSRYGGT